MSNRTGGYPCHTPPTSGEEELREIIAVEYERDGLKEWAAKIRAGATHPDLRVALAAMREAQLRSRPTQPQANAGLMEAGWKLTPVAAKDLVDGETYIVATKHGFIEGDWSAAEGNFGKYFWRDMEFWGDAFKMTPLSTPSVQEAEVAGGKPIDMILHCPKCGYQHVDEPDDRTPDWKNPPHRSHLCHNCGCIWRPADIATNGVKQIATQGKRDNFLFFGPGRQAPFHLPPDSEELRERLARMVRTLGTVPDDTQISDTDVSITASDIRAFATLSRLSPRDGMNERLLAELKRVRASLAIFVADSTDPGTEALAALHTSEQAIAAAESASENPAALSTHKEG